MVYRINGWCALFTDESASGGSIKNMLNEKLAEKL